MSQVRWLVVGLGDVAQKSFLPALRADPRSMLHGVVSRSRAKGAAFCGLVWTDLDEALADPQVDAVYVASPVHLHHAQTMAALRAGKHVLCEKPASLSYSEAAEMVVQAQKVGRILAIAYSRRLFPKLVRARELIQSGAIGRPVFAFASCSEWIPTQLDGRQWMSQPALAGSGPLYDIGSHRVDALNWLLGRPIKIGGELYAQGGALPTEDAATILIQYESGVRAVVDCRWNTQAITDGFCIVGERGELDLSPLSGDRLLGPGGEERLPSSSNRHGPIVSAFSESVLRGVSPSFSAKDCLSTAWVLDRARSEKWPENS